MSRIKIALVACVALAVPPSAGLAAEAPAEEKRLAVEDVLWLNATLLRMNCADKIIKDGVKESFVCDPYKWSPGISWMIATNQRKAQEIATQYSRLRVQAVNNLPRKPDGSPLDEAQAKFAVEDRKMLDEKVKDEFGHFKRSDLEPMNLPPSLLAGLLPIVD